MRGTGFGFGIVFLLALPGVLLTLPGCGRGADESGSGPAVLPAEAIAAWLDADRYLGEPLAVANLQVWPVYTKRRLDVGDFRTLAEAQTAGLVAIREVGGEAAATPSEGGVGQGRAGPRGRGVQELQLDVGQNDLAQNGLPQLANGNDQAVVNTLVIENQGDLPILVCAGTVVKGGKQDRQIGQDFVVRAHQTVPVDAYCVEPGRWSPRPGQEFGASGLVSYSGIAPKGVRSGGQYAKNQQEVWANVQVVLEKAAVEGAETTLLAATDQATDEAASHRGRLEEAVLAHFAHLAAQTPKPVGFAYAVDGKPETVRAFAHERLLRGQLPAFVTAMALEADLALRSRKPEAAEAPKPADAADVVALVNAINMAQPEYEATRAGNWNGYRIAEVGFNGACFLPDAEGQRSEVVLTVDWTSR